MLWLSVCLQAYEGLQTADRLTEQYVFLPHKVKDVYLYHLLTSCIAALQQQAPPAAAAAAAAGSSSGSSSLPAGLGSGVRSAIIFVSTCKGCKVLDQVLRELGVPAASLHSGVLWSALPADSYIIPGGVGGRVDAPKWWCRIRVVKTGHCSSVIASRFVGPL
jgi:hypothetical protein